MATRRPRFHLIDLMMIVVLCGLVAEAVRWVFDRAKQIGSGKPPSGGEFIGIFGLYLALVAWAIAWGVLRYRRNSPACKDCGRRFLPAAKKGDAAERCPACQRRRLGPAQWKEEQARGRKSLVVILLCFAFLAGLVLADFVRAHFGAASWVVLPLLSVGTVAGLCALLILALYVFGQVRLRFLRVERFALARARRVAGEEGELVRAGPRTYWYSGATDPVPSLIEQEEHVRRRAAAILGAAVEVRTPLRWLCFHRREALVAYHLQRATDLWGLDGLYYDGAVRTVTISTEVIPHRLNTPETTARPFLAVAALGDFKTTPFRPWLRQGLIVALAAGDDRDELDRLNRKMLAALAVGSALGPDLFRTEAKAVRRLIQGWTQHRDFATLHQFVAQTWSLVEYLGGGDAPEDRRRRFRAFLEETRPGEPDEATFGRQFGHGFGRLLGDWEAWVRGRGVGTHAAPTAVVREAILGRVVPIVRDRGALPMERIVAVRELGRVGFAAGADALIDLLHDPGEVPTEEILWSLRAIAGLDLGADPRRWSSWCSALPVEVSAPGP